MVGKKLQFNRAVLRHYSLLTSDFKHGDETRDRHVERDNIILLAVELEFGRVMAFVAVKD